MKFTNATWFHTVVVILICFVGLSIATLILEKVFSIKDRNLATVLSAVFIGPILQLYFIRRVKRK